MASDSEISEAAHTAFIGSARTPRDEEVGLTGAQGLALSPDGKHIYVAARTGSRIVILSRDSATGAVSIAEEIQSDDPTAIAVSPDGSHVYVTDDGADRVSAYSRNPTTGALALVADYGSSLTDALNGANAIAMSPDGNYAYVGSFLTDAVGVFSRNSGTGELSFVQEVNDDVGGVDGLERIESLTLSPGGEHLYVCGLDDDAIGVFSRNAGTGQLTFVEVVRNGVNGVVMMNGPTSSAVSPDGNHLYVVTGNADSAVVVFARNSISGELTFLSAYSSSSLVFALGVAVGPDGREVYATGFADGALIAFSRDSTTGALSEAHVQAQGVAGVDGLFEAYGVAVSPDSQHVYASASAAVSAFRRVTASCASTPQVCLPPGGTGASLLIKDGSPDKADRLMWKWPKGATIPLVDLGDPITGGTDYALCVYDSSGGPGERLEIVVAAGGGCGSPKQSGATLCWKALNDGYRYSSKARNPDGVLSARLFAGQPGRSTITLKAAGENLPLLALPLVFPVTVQLQASNGECWEAAYSSPDANTATLLRTRAD